MTTKEENVNEADKIWQEIQNLPIDVFTISGQTVKDYAVKMEVPGAELYVKLSASAALPALEATVTNVKLTRGKLYSVEAGEGYCIVKRVQQNPVGTSKKM